MLRSIFLIGIILSSVVFTPFAFGQELQKSTWLETAAVIYDQKFAKAVQASVTFETINNNEIQFPDELIEKIMSHEEIRFVLFTNMNQCVMGVSSDEQCIMIGFNRDLLKGDLGINAIHENGKRISDELITDIISGPAKGTIIQTVFLKTDTGTNVSFNIDLKLNLKTKILRPLIKKYYKMILTSVLYKMNNKILEEN